MYEFLYNAGKIAIAAMQEKTISGQDNWKAPLSPCRYESTKGFAIIAAIHNFEGIMGPAANARGARTELNWKSGGIHKPCRSRTGNHLIRSQGVSTVNSDDKTLAGSSKT